MSRPSRLYKRLGLPDGVPLLSVELGPIDLSDNVTRLSITRGGSSLSEHAPSTITVETPLNVELVSSDAGAVTLTPEAAAFIAPRAFTTTAAIRNRFTGRVARQTARDKGDKQGGWRGTTLIGAAWSSILERSPDLYQPVVTTSLATASAALFQPAWEPRCTRTWLGDSDTWAATPADPITASDLLRIVTERLHTIADIRSGPLRIQTLEHLEARCAIAAENAWPLARAHCLAETTWDQPSAYPTEYRLDYKTPAGDDFVITGGGGATTRLVHLDWRDFVSRSEQWRRVYGLRWDTIQNFWHLPSVTVRVDHLLASDKESNRRAAGMVLGLDVGDPVALAGDWPAVGMRGIHIVTAITETLTAGEWSITLALASYRSLAGQPHLPIPPRTWNQAAGRTWDSPSANHTWNEGLTP